MREIKFRAWDEATKTMSTPFTVFSPDIHIYRGWELMQYTGLKDKNGKEIYEGDIIRVEPSTPNYELIEEIKWIGDGNWMADKQPLVGFIHHSSIYKKPIEVIGNIYEHPELLK